MYDGYYLFSNLYVKPTDLHTDSLTKLGVFKLDSRTKIYNLWGIKNRKLLEVDSCLTALNVFFDKKQKPIIRSVQEMGPIGELDDSAWIFEMEGVADKQEFLGAFAKFEFTINFMKDAAINPIVQIVFDKNQTNGKFCMEVLPPKLKMLNRAPVYDLPLSRFNDLNKLIDKEPLVHFASLYSWALSQDRDELKLMLLWTILESLYAIYHEKNAGKGKARQVEIFIRSLNLLNGKKRFEQLFEKNDLGACNYDFIYVLRNTLLHTGKRDYSKTNGAEQKYVEIQNGFGSLDSMYAHYVVELATVVKAVMLYHILKENSNGKKVNLNVDF